MPIHRVSCVECGLAATRVRSGDRGLTSFSEEAAAALCLRGRDAVAAQSVLESVAQCEHLAAAIAEAESKSEPKAAR